MGKQTFTKITKILSFLLLVSFIMSVTAASASAISVKGPRDYQIGYRAGSQYGYKVGHHDGYEDCLKYGQKGVLTHIPAPAIKNDWTKNYKRGYKGGYKKGYIAGYNDGRYKCLQKETLSTNKSYNMGHINNSRVPLQKISAKDIIK